MVAVCGRRDAVMPRNVQTRVHGIATAAGCQLVSMCDLAVASDAATFALPGVNLTRAFSCRYGPSRRIAAFRDNRRADRAGPKR